MRALGLAIVLCVLSPSLVQADGSSGAITGHVGSAGGDFGGGLLVDLGLPVCFLRLGGVFGGFGLSSENDERSRVFMPLGASIALVLPSGPLRFELRGRGGGWGGATHDGLRVGGFVSGGAYFGVSIGRGVAIGVGADAIWLLGHGDRTIVAPGLTLTWQ